MSFRGAAGDEESPIVGLAQAYAYLADRQFDKAIEASRKIAADNPTFGRTHGPWGPAYWGEHRYPEAIQEFKLEAKLEGDKNLAEFAVALDTGFHSGGKPAALRKGIEVRLA